MVLYSQLVCSACRKVLTYPLGAISCKCRNCNRINPSLHMEIVCENCETTLFLPANTLTALCPCCFTVTEIPVDKLPMIENVILEGEGEDDKKSRANAKTIYVEHTGGNAAGRGKVSVATQIPLGPLPEEQGHLEGEAAPANSTATPTANRRANNSPPRGQAQGAVAARQQGRGRGGRR
eukprot:GILI01032306.1.p1 GENE.GILI01032306.1~~GILI01032306.1.p1  ORF type:complete len:179 (+),score=8.23 GILI01032306.1:47-583(+)